MRELIHENNHRLQLGIDIFYIYKGYQVLEILTFFKVSTICHMRIDWILLQFTL